jgi:hypothetical protein
MSVTSTSTAFAAALLLGACAQVLGVDQYSVSSKPTGAAVFSFKDRVCEDCVRASCASSLDTCAAGSPCSTWEACTAQCKLGDDVCARGCYTKVGATNGPIADVAMCTFEHCLDACQSSSGVYPAYGRGCGSTYRTSCASQAQACAGNADCLELSRCMLEKNCLLEAPPGEPLTAASLVSRNPACAYECGDQAHLYVPRTPPDGGLATNATLGSILCNFYGPGEFVACDYGELQCVGRYTWGSASSSVIHVTTLFTDTGLPEAPGIPLEDATVSACNPQSLNCSPPEAAPQQTGADGEAQFDLPTSNVPLRLYFEVVTGWTDGPSLLLYYPGRSLIRDTFLSFQTGGTDLSGLKQPGSRYVPFAGPWIAGRGGIIARMFGCSGRAVFGLKLALDGDRDAGSSPIVYFDSLGQYLSLSPTDSTIQGYIAAIEPGLHTISAWNGDQEVAEEQVVVKADALTILPWLFPKRAPGAGE